MQTPAPPVIVAGHTPHARIARCRTAPSRVARLLAALGALLTAAAVVLLGAPAALAHDHLLSSDPGDGASVQTAPSAITLEFSDSPQPVSPRVRVTAADGTVVADGEPSIDGTRVSLPLPQGTPTGRMTVQWRVVSHDGHPIEGTFGFDVAQGSAPVAAGATPSASASASPSPTTAASGPTAAADSTADTGLSPAVIAIVVVVLLALIGLGFALVRRRGRSR